MNIPGYQLQRMLAESPPSALSRVCFQLRRLLRRMRLAWRDYVG